MPWKSETSWVSHDVTNPVTHPQNVLRGSFGLPGAGEFSIVRLSNF
jgi:hypothetical protein